MNRIAIAALIISIASSASGLAGAAGNPDSNRQEPVAADRPAKDADKVLEPRTGTLLVAVMTDVQGPGGRIGSGTDGKTSSMLGPRVHLGLELGTRPNESWAIMLRGSLYAGSAGSVFKDICDLGREAEEADGSTGADAETCGAFGGGAGIHVRYDLSTRVSAGSVLPWLGYGVGYEWVELSGSTGGSPLVNATFNGNFSGINFAMPALGFDVLLANRVLFGLYASATVGRYVDRHARLRVEDMRAKGDFDNYATHYWMGGGLRLGSF